jgi:hypothetical protein
MLGASMRSFSSPAEHEQSQAYHLRKYLHPTKANVSHNLMERFQNYFFLPPKLSQVQGIFSLIEIFSVQIMDVFD